MVPGGQVTFQFEWERMPETADGEVEYIDLDVSARITDYDPGCIYGPPERCYPPEGGEVEDLEVVLPSGVELLPIPRSLLDQLVEAAQDEHRKELL